MQSRRRSQHGFSMIEAVVSVLVVAGLFSVAMNTVGASRARQAVTTERARAQTLASDLMAEILRLPYQDPYDTSVGIGVEGAEASAAGRTGFDDVDDYHEWSATPPKNRDGVAIDGFAGWTRQVQVSWASASNPEATATSATGIKRITVRVLRGKAELASLTALRSDTWIEPVYAHSLEER